MADWYFRTPQNPAGGLRPCPACRNLVDSRDEFCPYCARRLRAEGGVRSFLRKYFARPDSVTRTLIGLLVLVFLLQLVADVFLPARFRISSGDGSGLFGLLTSDTMTYIRMGANVPSLLRHYYSESWRLLAYCFLHMGLIHLLFNGYAFWDLGRLAERLWGGRQLFATFVLTGIAGGMASAGWALCLGRPGLSVGASGSICGVLGLLLGAYHRNKHYVGQDLGAQLVKWAVYILIFGLVLRADNAAHIGGMFSGAALGYYLPPTNHSRTFTRDMRFWNIAARVSAVLLAVSAVCAVYFFSRGPEHVMAL